MLELVWTPVIPITLQSAPYRQWLRPLSPRLVSFFYLMKYLTKTTNAWLTVPHKCACGGVEVVAVVVLVVMVLVPQTEVSGLPLQVVLEYTTTAVGGKWGWGKMLFLHLSSQNN